MWVLGETSTHFTILKQHGCSTLCYNCAQLQTPQAHPAVNLMDHLVPYYGVFETVYFGPHSEGLQCHSLLSCCCFLPLWLLLPCSINNCVGRPSHHFVSSIILASFWGIVWRKWWLLQKRKRSRRGILGGNSSCSGVWEKDRKGKRPWKIS